MRLDEWLLEGLLIRNSLLDKFWGIEVVKSVMS